VADIAETQRWAAAKFCTQTVDKIVRKRTDIR